MILAITLSYIAGAVSMFIVLLGVAYLLVGPASNYEMGEE